MRKIAAFTDFCLFVCSFLLLAHCNTSMNVFDSLCCWPKITAQVEYIWFCDYFLLRLIIITRFMDVASCSDHMSYVMNEQNVHCSAIRQYTRGNLLPTLTIVERKVRPLIWSLVCMRLLLMHPTQCAMCNIAAMSFICVACNARNAYTHDDLTSVLIYIFSLSLIFGKGQKWTTANLRFYDRESCASARFDGATISKEMT